MGHANAQQQSVCGWGRHPQLYGTVARPEQRAAVSQFVATHRSVLPQGARRSYGDAALHDDGLMLRMTRLNRMLAFDADTGVLRAEAGVRLRDILTVFVPRGWFLPVTPGTKAVTLGGAVAFDVHGKNHHCDGGFSAFVREIELLTADGAVLRCSPERNEDVFWATVSGAGLTGVMTEVSLQLTPIETAFIVQRSIKARDLDDAFALFERHEPHHPYAVAWIDCLAPGHRLGRSHVLFGRHAVPRDLSAEQRTAPLAYTPSRLGRLPVDLPSGVLNRATVRAFNELYYARQRTRDRRTVTGLDAFFYPLDAIGDWNRMYGPRGFVQFQCVLPLEESYAGLVSLLETVQQHGHASFLAVLKRLGPPDGGLLSFPMHGYTLALDLPYRDGLPALMDRLHEIVLQHDGRVYLAKDAYLRPDMVRAMYPQLPEWQAVKRAVDPNTRFGSALARRLAMVPAA